ncbi:hypothetical protein [Spirosoma sp. KUDC1026]|uniref:hypothetical protein n=1 Tax=Spirosoma sp. KUDC1026 TaxID=2745947 RepID=UPI00159BA185|nr:hypothetical protein [Spirosoma sp. KUDC1026]QKZ13094.1 hypothetical protein HU175_10800 [Spirosoma sp. KUDC1026]
MIDKLPLSLSGFFILTVLLTLTLFIWTIRKADASSIRNKAVLILSGLVVWLLIQATITLNGVYSSNPQAIPPRIMLLGILPTIICILLLFVTQRSRQFLDSLPLSTFTYLHTVRIPVELTLYWLFLHGAVPEIMTFEGHNFDILAGLTAPLVAYFGFKKRSLSPSLILLWNVVCLGLLGNIVATALLSAPSPLQRLAFNQPNIAILHFPFSWLPSLIVPLVLLTHLTAIRRFLIDRQA